MFSATNVTWTIYPRAADPAGSQVLIIALVENGERYAVVLPPSRLMARAYLSGRAVELESTQLLARNVKLVKSSNPVTRGADAVASTVPMLDPFETIKWPTRGAEATGMSTTARIVPDAHVAIRANENVIPGTSCRAGMERCAGVTAVVVVEMLPNAVASDEMKQNRLLGLSQTQRYDVQFDSDVDEIQACINAGWSQRTGCSSGKGVM